jgi:CubicO group peptidase (beta-lactamase class C family)
VTLTALTGATRGYSDPRLSPIVERLDDFVAADPDYSFQLCAYHAGELVLDAWGGPHLSADSLIVPFSVTKNTIGLSIGLLFQRGILNPDERVASYWPEFAAKGKQDITVRMLLSHQAGLPQAQPSLSWAEVFDDHLGATALARSRPLWHPGSAFGYHALTIGNLASELVFRASGRTLREFYEEELRAPLGIDFYLGLPPRLDERRVPVLPIIQPENEPPAAWSSPLTAVAMSMSGPPVDFANDEASWRFGHPSGSGIGSARALARLFAATVTGLEGAPPLFEVDTIDVLSQQQVHGYDEVLGQADRAHSIVFQKPTKSMPFGGHRAFGHDGAAGAFACADPDAGLAFAYTVARGPWPGGADPRAIGIAAELGRMLNA